MITTPRLIDRLFIEALNTPEGRKVYTEKTLLDLLLKKETRRNGDRSNKTI